MERSHTALPRSLLTLVVGLLLVFVAMPTLADPPTRAARISLVSGNASFSPSGSDEWTQARINRPIWIGDRVWSGDGRIELQLGGASLRLAPGTSLQVLNFDDRIAQFEVTQGNVALHVRAIDSNDTIEIDTPSFAFVTREVGDYRIDVERDRTAVSTRRGAADIYGQDVAYRIDRRERFAFYTPDLRDYDAGPLPPADAFDRWARERAQREDRSTSSRYVSPELVGFVDLDSHGDWRTDATHGNVWVPRVDVNWAPYRYGNWTWVDPWGWTWVDDAPWGFAPSHYGRWTQLGRSWAWVPGPRNVRPTYSPALVAWVGGDNFSLTVSSGGTRGVGWFPLAPGEVWRPSYDVSRDYFTRVNVSNTVVNNTTVINVYNTRNDVNISNRGYRFHAAPAAVTAVPVDTFVQGRPVQLTQAQLNANAVAQANVLPAAPARPVMQSLVGAAPRSQAKPPAETVQRPVVARTAPAAVHSIEQRASLVREGKPVSREALERAPQAAQPATPQKPATAAPAPGQAPAAQAPPAAVVPGQLRSNVRVVESDKATPKPLPTVAEGGGRAARTESEKGRPPQAAQPGQPPQAAQPGQPPQAAQPGQPPQAAQPGRPQVAAPQAGGAPPASAAAGGQTPPPSQPPQATPPGRPPTVAPAAGPPGQSREGAQPAPAAVAPKAPVPPTPTPTSPPPVAPPAAKAPGAAPPNVDQLRGRDEPSGRRVPPPDDRRAQPAQAQPVLPAVAPPVSPPKRAETAAPTRAAPAAGPASLPPSRAPDASPPRAAAAPAPAPAPPAAVPVAKPVPPAAAPIAKPVPPAAAPIAKPVPPAAAPIAKPAPPEGAPGVKPAPPAPPAQGADKKGQERGKDPRSDKEKDKEKDKN